MALPPLPPLNLTGGAGGAAGPATSGVGSITPAFDSSNWTVATGGSKATGGAGIPMLYIVAGAAILGYILWKKR